jgi:uncharacterized protein YaiI (UPF0178 family)
MQILIDGDGSPVKDTTIEIAATFQLPVVIVTSIAHFTNKEYPDFVKLIYVDRGSDMADYKIVALVNKGDVVITQDYGLASLVLPKARVLHQSGVEYTNVNMNQLLEQRYLGSKLRKAGQKTRGPKPYTEQDRANFKKTLTEILQSSE